MTFIAADKKVSDIPTGTMTLAQVGEKEVLLSNVNGKICATTRLCPHASASLVHGILEGSELTCVSHGAVYDVISGELLDGPGEYGLFCYALKMEGDEILVEVS
jgi:nitrite reductase/ring-hydroxylating ferredoxin subunit